MSRKNFQAFEFPAVKGTLYFVDFNLRQINGWFSKYKINEVDKILHSVVDNI